MNDISTFMMTTTTSKQKKIDKKWKKYEKKIHRFLTKELNQFTPLSCSPLRKEYTSNIKQTDIFVLMTFDSSLRTCSCSVKTKTRVLWKNDFEHPRQLYREFVGFIDDFEIDFNVECYRY